MINHIDMLCFILMSTLLCIQNAAASIIDEHMHGRFQFVHSVYTTTVDLGVAYVTVQRNLGHEGRAAVFVSTRLAKGNAVSGIDYHGLYNHSLVWLNGEHEEKELYIPILNSGDPQEETKNFFLFLHEASGGEVNNERSEAEVILQPPSNLYAGKFNFLDKSISTMETPKDSGSILSIPVIWELGSIKTASVGYNVICEGPCSPSDFTILSPPILTWERGKSSIQHIHLHIIDDGEYEQSEYFRVQLQRLEIPPTESDDSLLRKVGMGKVGANSEILITILGPNNVQGGIMQFRAECFPACISDNYAISDGGVARIIIQRRNGSDGEASVAIQTHDETAMANIDYIPKFEVLKWGDGDSSDRVVQITGISGVPRLESVRFSATLTLLNTFNVISGQAAQVSNHGGKISIDIVGPRNINYGYVDFVNHKQLLNVLKFPDLDFLPYVTLLDSTLNVCPYILVTEPGLLQLQVHRHSMNFLGRTSVVFKIRDGRAIGAVDYEPWLQNEGMVVWNSNEHYPKSIYISIMDPGVYYHERRSFFVEIIAVEGADIGQCNELEIILEQIHKHPTVTSFSIDMNSGELTLDLDIPVLPATLVVDRLLLQSKVDVSDSRSETFQPGPDTAITSMHLENTRVVLLLSKRDRWRLQSTISLSKNATTTFLSLEDGLFQYLSPIGCIGVGCSRQSLHGISRHNALSVMQFIPDTTKPHLERFSLDLQLKMLKLEFSKPVDFNNKVNVDGLSLAETSDAGSASPQRYYLTPLCTSVFISTQFSDTELLDDNVNIYTSYGTLVTLLLCDKDIIGIQSIGSGTVGKVSTSTYLGLQETFIKDHAFPPNAVTAIEVLDGTLLLSSPVNCSPCEPGSYMSNPCTSTKDRICSICSTCPKNTFAIQICNGIHDTACYPCTECRGGEFIESDCLPNLDRICAKCRKCTEDEFEDQPCAEGKNRECRTCNSCHLTPFQQKLCATSVQWKKLRIKSPYSCPKPNQRFLTLEDRLQRSKSNRCGAGRCSCTGNLPGNANPYGLSFPDDPRCTGPEVFNIN